MIAAEDREEEAQRTEEQGGVTHLGDDGAQPVAPCGGEADEVAQACAHVGVHAGIQVRLAERQRLEDVGDAQHAHAGDGPADQRRAGRGHGRNVLRQREDAGADGGADNEADECAHVYGAWVVLAQDLGSGDLGVVSVTSALGRWGIPIIRDIHG